MKDFAAFDAADYLDEEETIAEYLTAALEDPDPGMFFVAVKDERGKGRVARQVAYERRG